MLNNVRSLTSGTPIFIVNNMLMDKILKADVRKKSKLNSNGVWYTHSFMSFDRYKLKDEIERHYGIKLIKSDSNDFPYFTDGGFKYTGEDECWFFEVESYWYNII